MIILTDKMLVIPVGISPNYSGTSGKPELEDKSVEITENGDYNYTASEHYDGIGNFNVKVNVPIESEKTVFPSFEEDITVLPSEGFDAMSSVIVKKAEANLQDKTVDKASTSEIVLTADEGYQGLGTVTVAPIKTTSVTADPSTNVQEVNANTEENEYITSVTVNPVKTKSLSITPRIVEQTFTASEYLYNTVNVSAIKHTEKTYDSSTNTQTYDYVENNYEFIEKLTINPVTSNIDPNIVPENIAKGVSILGVTGNLEAGSTPGTPTEAYAIRQYFQGGYLAYPINVRLTTNSWVSFDFAMSEKALENYYMPILGVHDGALRLFIENGNLILDTLGIERHINYKLDIARHNISFGFVNDVNPSNGDVRFKVEIDNNVMFNDYIVAPNFNLPLFLFGSPSVYTGTYEEYELLGGVTFLLNEIGISVSTDYYYIFGLKVYNVDNSGERNLIRDYEPAIDALQKPCLLEKLSNEYEYPTLGTFMYVAVPTAVPNEIANSDYGSEVPQQCYIKPSEGAIVPTDIKLTPTTRIVMYTGDTGTFDEVSADATEEEILKSRVMVGAQPNLLISAYDENDVRRGLPGYEESHSMSTDSLIWQLAGGKGLYFGGCSNILYSTSDTDGNFTMFIFGNDKLCFGYDVADTENANFDSDSLNKILNTNYDSTMPDNSNKKAVSPTYSQFNNEMNTPICFFGNYNETTMKPDEVIALGYQEALTQIGYTTGIRYEIKRIEIYDRDSDGSISRKHMLLPARDTNDKVLLYDVITEKSYYPFNGTLDVISGTPTIQDIPAPTIITNTYIKPSEGAIVPTDIKYTTLTNITMHVKGFDNFDAETDESARAMIGAFPHLSISPFNRNDAEQGFSGFGRPTQEQLDLLGDSSIGLIFSGGNVIYSPFITNYDGINATGTPQTLTMDGEHVITFGHDPVDINNINMDNDTDLIKKISIDEQGQMLFQRSYVQGVYKFIDNQMVTPICIFGKYNSTSESLTPDDVIALGYENALNRIGYVTGARYGVKQIDINVRNADGSMTTTHSLVPARDKDGIICLYDNVSHKSYYPFHGTLDII